MCYTVHKEWYPAPLGPSAEVSSHIISHNSYNSPALKCCHLFFFLPWCSFLPAVLIFLLPLGTVALMSCLISQGSDALLHLVFTVKPIAHVRRPCSGPASPGEAVRPQLECQTPRASVTLRGVVFPEKRNIICMVLCPCPPCASAAELCAAVHHYGTAEILNIGKRWDFDQLICITAAVGNIRSENNCSPKCHRSCSIRIEWTK